VRTALAFAKTSDGPIIACVTDEMVAADSLDRHDLSRLQSRAHEGQRMPGLLDRLGARAHERQGRSAGRTGQRLGVKTAVQGVLVLGPAARTERKSGHGSVRPVIRKAHDEGVARTTLGTVDERVAMAAILRVRQLRQALLTGEVIGRHEDSGLLAVLTVEDVESAARRNALCLGAQQDRFGQRRGIFKEFGAKGIQLLGVSLGEHLDHA
jgi:hypothetical protein